MDDKTLLTDDHITFLLSYCSNVPELYNKISNMLYKIFPRLLRRWHWFVLL